MKKIYEITGGTKMNICIPEGLKGSERTISFQTCDSELPEILKLCENGDIFVKGKLIENDKEVVDAMREFLSSQGLINH